jgi:hypothetical protein
MSLQLSDSTVQNSLKAQITLIITDKKDTPIGGGATAKSIDGPFTEVRSVEQKNWVFNGSYIAQPSSLVTVKFEGESMQVDFINNATGKPDTATLVPAK